MATAAAPQSAMQQLNANGSGASPTQSADPTADAPQELTGEQIAAKAQLDQRCQDALIELRTTFKQRYQPKRRAFVSEATRAFEAIRGSTFALLNDQSAALDTINQLVASGIGFSFYLEFGSGEPRFNVTTWLRYHNSLRRQWVILKGGHLTEEPWLLPTPCACEPTRHHGSKCFQSLGNSGMLIDGQAPERQSRGE